MKAETIAEQLFFTTARLEATTAEGASVGTGFVYEVMTDNGAAHLLVTNKHVVAGASDLTIRFVQSDGSGQPILGRATQVTISEFGEHSWTGHADSRVDVAVVPLQPALNEMARLGAPPFYRTINADLSAGVGADFESDALEEVTFIGYPNGIFDAVNYLPVARRGMTATPMDVDYEGIPAFLIDASVFQGSSGSPVFVVNRGIYTNRAGTTHLGSRIAFVGVVAAVHQRTVTGAVIEVPTRFVAAIQEPIDLGIVFKARCIDETVRQALAKYGLSVVTADAASAAVPAS